MSSTLLLQVHLEAFSYDGSKDLLKGIQFSLNRGSKIALSGSNGSGKSTLLKLIAGVLDGAEGTIRAFEKVRLSIQHPDIPRQSGGESRREILNQTFSNPRAILLFDEPTNDLDEDAKLEFLTNLDRLTEGGAIIVSHDPDVLDRVDAIWELRNGSLLRHPPGFQAYLERIAKEQERLSRRVAQLENDLRKGKERAQHLVEQQEKRAVRGKKSANKRNLPRIVSGAKKSQAETTLAKISHAQDRIKTANAEELRAMKSRLRQMTIFDWDTMGSRPPNGKRMVRIHSAFLSGFRRALTFEFSGPKRIHLRGRNGSGKSTLLRALAGMPDALSRVEGNFYAADPFQLFDQKLSQFSGSELLWEWFRDRIEAEASLARSILGKLGFEQEEQCRPISALSGGERIRMELAVSLNQAALPQLLLLDEPTNHLDPESRSILTAFLNGFQGAMIVVSHDDRFLDSIKFDEILDLDRQS